jgi:hypothetical protein
LQKTVFFFNSDPGNVLSFNGKILSGCMKRTTSGCFLSQFSQAKSLYSMQSFSLMKRLAAAMASAGDFFGESVKSGKG